MWNQLIKGFGCSIGKQATALLCHGIPMISQPITKLSSPYTVNITGDVSWSVSCTSPSRGSLVSQPAVNFLPFCTFFLPDIWTEMLLFTLYRWPMHRSGSTGWHVPQLQAVAKFWTGQTCNPMNCSENIKYELSTPIDGHQFWKHRQSLQTILALTKKYADPKTGQLRTKEIGLKCCHRYWLFWCDFTGAPVELNCHFTSGLLRPAALPY